MAENSNQDNVFEHIKGTNLQKNEESINDVQDGPQTIEPEQKPKPDGAEKKEGPTVEKNQDVAEVGEGEKPKASKLKAFWDRLGLDPGTLILMFKGSVPPLITIAFYQAPAVAATYGALGYVIPIISIVSMCILPRAKYIQNLVLNLIATCLGTAIALLGIWSAIQARKHTTPAGSEAAYNSSQSAICAIWLMANIWLVNVLRAKYPTLQFTSLMYSIFTNVAFSFGPIFQTMDEAQTLIKELLEVFLTGMAVSTAVSLFLIPITSRTVVFGEMKGYIGGIRGTIKAQTAYLESLEKSDMFNKAVPDDVDNAEGDRNSPVTNGKPTIAKQTKADLLKASISGLTTLHGKLHADIPFAKQEMAYGKLGPKDLDELFMLLQAILVPLIGMSTITDIFERIAERRGWIRNMKTSGSDDVKPWEKDPGEVAKKQEKELWNGIMKELHNSFETVSKAMDEGMEHAGLSLELIKPEKMDKATADSIDVEARGDVVKPGEKGFSEYLEKKLADFYSKRGETLRTWARGRGLSEEQFDAARSPGLDSSEPTPDENHHRRDQEQLYLILYMEFLLYSTGVAILKFIHFADHKVDDGTMKKSRLIKPGQRRIRKWIMNLGTEDSSVDSNVPDSLEGGSPTVYLGPGFNIRKDPEHLPATTIWEKLGNGVRAIPRFFGSVEAGFGTRVTLATMSIGILAFLEQTQTFFLQQRIVWAMIIVAISMTVTAGQSVFGLLARTGGTALAMVNSIVIWYIVDQHAPGVIVFLWLSTFILYYFFLKFPRFIPVWLVCIITQVLILGYELQVQVVGIAAATKSGQPYYPVYELAPYRLACVVAGCFVAFFWTIFPYPLTDRGWLRKDLGATIYLLANYYSVVDSTVHARISRTEGNMEDKNSPGRKLEKVRHKIFGKLLILLPSLHQHADWEKWEPTLGGKFPLATYNSIIFRLTNILNYMSLVSYATQTWSIPPFPTSEISTPSQRAWLKDLSILLQEVGPTTHVFTSVLTLLSASVTQGTALPPYMPLPEPYEISNRLEKLDKGILDSRHIMEPGYSAYAVMQVASSLLTGDLKRLVDDVKSLVGEVDFSFTVVNDDTSSNKDGETLDSGKGKQD